MVVLAKTFKWMEIGIVTASGEHKTAPRISRKTASYLCSYIAQKAARKKMENLRMVVK